MTVSSEAAEAAYVGNGVTTAFATGFRFLAAAHLLVTKASPGGAPVPQVLNLDYSVTGVDAPAGGTVTFATAPAAGDTILIRRILPAVQLTDYVEGDAFPAETHERALDYLTMLAQQTARACDRAVRAPPGESVADMPPAPARAGKLLAFDAAGQPVMASGTGNDPDLRADLAAAGGAALVGSAWGTVAAKLALLTQEVNGLSAALVSATPPRIFVQEPPTLPPGAERLLVLTLVGADLTEDYYVKAFFRDDILGGRFQFILTRVSDSVDVAGIAPSGSPLVPTGFSGLRFFDLVDLAGSGIGGVIGVDFGDGTPRWAIYAGTPATTQIVDVLTYFDNPLFRNAVERIAGPLIDSGLAAGGFIRPTATDAYAKALFPAGVVGNGDPDDDLWLNYETIYFPAIPLYRVRLFLHSTRFGAEIARWSWQAATYTPGDLPPRVLLAGMLDGGRPPTWPDDPGITAHIDVDWSKVEWTHVLTTHSGSDATGIRKVAIRTTEETQSAWLSEAGPAYEMLLTVGATNGQYATVQAAIDALSYPAAGAPFSRSTWPSSMLVSPERPALIEVVDPHDEEILGETVTFPGPVTRRETRLRIPDGVCLRLRHDTRLWMNDAPETAPVIDFNFTGRIEGGGGLIEQLGPGYVIHQDANNGTCRIVVPGAGARRRITQVIRNVRLARAIDDGVPMIGGGTNNAQRVVFDGVHFARSAHTAGGDDVFFHSSPNEEVAARIEMRNCTTTIPPAGTSALLSVSKIYTATVRHEVGVTGSEAARVKAANTVGGPPGFVRRGTLSGATVVGTSIEP